jgi:alpha-1,2-glucosyltransferase
MNANPSVPARRLISHLIPRPRVPRALAALLFAVALGSGLWVAKALPPLGDEPHHVAQIRLFLLERWVVTPALTTIPGYHALIALIARVVGLEDVAHLRVYSFAISLTTLCLIFSLARRAGDDREVERLLQIGLLPILFPMLFLLYTDVAALLVLVIALLLHERSKHIAAGLAATAALLVRQNYVVWLLFVASLTIASTREMRDVPRRLLGFALGLIAFGAFVLWNGGVAIGDRTMHPFGLYLGNLYFALFVAFLLLLPLHIANAEKLVMLARRPATLALLGAFFPLFLFTFTLDHPYNQPELNWFLHNRLLTVLVSSVWTKLGMFVGMSIALLSLAVTPLRTRAHRLVYLFAVLSLLPAWMIEQRYYLPPLVLFLLYRRQESLAIEWSLIAYEVLLAALLFTGVVRQSFFL